MVGFKPVPSLAECVKKEIPGIVKNHIIRSAYNLHIQVIRSHGHIHLLVLHQYLELWKRTFAEFYNHGEGPFCDCNQISHLLTLVHAKLE